MKKISLVIIALLLAGPLARAADVVVETGSGEINWSQGVIHAQGFGTAREGLNPAQKRLLSRRAAVVDGQRNLLELTKGVRITSLTKVKDAMLDSSVTASRVQGVIKGAVVIKESYQNDIYAVTMAMPIGGELLKIVYDKPTTEMTFSPIPPMGGMELYSMLDRQVAALEAFIIPGAYAAGTAATTANFVIENDKEARAVKRIIGWMKGNPADVTAGLQQAIANFEEGQFSGLLIDASAVSEFELATIPQIRDEEGNVIYPNDNTSYGDIVNKRGVSYDFDLEDAVRNQRVARIPLIISATSTYKNLPSDLVITKADAQKILNSASTRSAMNKAGVLIVVPI